MTPETWIAIAGVIFTVFNTYLTARARADIAELKVWCLQTFIEKADARSMVQGAISTERTHLS